MEIVKRGRFYETPQGDRLIGEPVTREDGTVIYLCKAWGNDVRVFIEPRPGYHFYNLVARNDVVALGEGDRLKGVFRVGEAYFKVDGYRLHHGGRPLLRVEMEILTSQ